MRVNTGPTAGIPAPPPPPFQIAERRRVFLKFAGDVQPALMEQFVEQAPPAVVAGVRTTITNLLGTLPPQFFTVTVSTVGENLQQLVHSLTQDTPAPIETLAPELPAAVRSVVMRMIAKVPAERCHWVDEFLAAVSAAGRRL